MMWGCMCSCFSEYLLFYLLARPTVPFSYYICELKLVWHILFWGKGTLMWKLGLEVVNDGIACDAIRYMLHHY